MLLGALAHNFVDSFTHETGLAVSKFPILTREVLGGAGTGTPLFRLLQYSGSALGMTMILTTYGLALRRRCFKKGDRLWQDARSWLLLAALAVSTVLVAVLLNATRLPEKITFLGLWSFGFTFLISWIPIFLLGLLLLGFVRRDRR